ncbi:hypothetical protein [Clostridium cibarium]|nr:hypothetical protein [Clostridium cibarium]
MKKYKLDLDVHIYIYIYSMFLGIVNERLKQEGGDYVLGLP